MTDELTENLSFFCTKEMADEIRMVAAIKKISRSELYRRAIAKYLEEQMKEVYQIIDNHRRTTRAEI